MRMQLKVDIQDVAYRDTPTAPLLARLYRPAGDGPFPAVVSMHGGRWVAETRLTNAVLDHALAAAGIVVMALDVRMPPQARYPEPVQDINYAIRWLKRRATEFNSSARLVGGVGTSSGGHQVMLNALQPTRADYASLALAGSTDTAQLGFVVACWPVLDPLARYHMAKLKGMDLHVQAHDSYWPDEPAMAQGNPQRILERGEQQFMPPVLLIQGTDDTTVLPEMTDRFAETYRAKGGAVTVDRFEGETHTFITKRPGTAASDRAIDCIARFIRDWAVQARP
jgi:acetyl esterase